MVSISSLGMSLDTGFDTGGLFYLRCLASKELNPLPILYNGLITATAQGHINGDSGKIIVFVIRVPVHSKSNA